MKISFLDCLIQKDMSGITSYLIGTLLLVTSGLKTLNPPASLVLEGGYGVPHGLFIAAVQAELIVGFLLLFGWRPYLGWLGALTLFLIFAAISLQGALAGRESCGCFGPLHIDPRWTLALDFTVVIVLLVQRQRFIARKPPLAKTTAFAGMVGYLMFGTLSLFITIGSHPTALQAGQSLPVEGGLVVLEPAQWINQEFPLGSAILPRIECETREWIVLLYHHDCPKCQKALRQYERLARHLALHGESTQVALVELPPFGIVEFGGAGHAHRARLSSTREWFVQAPVEIQLREGKVTLASLDLPSISEVP